jgi:septum formation protein
VTPIVLASTSATRAAILRGAAASFSVEAPEVDEDAWKARLLADGAAPGRIAAVLADEKALAVSRGSAAVVIGADQTLELDGALHDKTSAPPETRARLEALRGREHRLHTAAAVAQQGSVLWRHSSVARLTMRAFSDAFLDEYMARCGEAAASSVGAYQLEGMGAQLFESIDGDYFSILGLPLIPLLGFLRRAGALPR